MRTLVANWSFTTVMTIVGLAVAVVVGSFFTAQAVVEGNLMATFVRFVLSIAVGVYYLYLTHLSQGRRFFSERW